MVSESPADDLAAMGGNADSNDQTPERHPTDTINNAEPTKPSGEMPLANGKAETNDGQDTANDADAETGDAAALRGAPESYADFTVPDGVEVQDDKLGKFQDLARELDLSQSGAQRLVDLQAEFTAEAMEQQRATWAELQSQWIGAVKSDREIGGDKLSETIAVAMRAVDRFGTAGLKEAMDLYGFGNHPDLVRTFYRIGQAISPDAVNVPASGPGGPINKSVAERVYPDQGGR